MRALLRLPSLTVAALVLAASACSQVQDFHGPSDPPPAVAVAATPPAQALAPACGTVDDPASCGACGHSCLGGTCSAGVCQPVVLAVSQGVGVGVEPYYAGPRAIATDDTHVYWVAKPGLFRVPIAGGVTEKLADASAVSTYATNSDDRTNLIVLHGPHVYLRSANQTRVVRVPKTGGAATPVTPVADAEWTVGELGFHGEQLVWMEQAFMSRHVLWTCDSLPCDASARHEAWDTDTVIDGLTVWPATFASDGAHLCIAFDPTTVVSGGSGVVCLGGGKQRITSGVFPVGSLVAAGAASADHVTVYGSTGGMVFRTVLGTDIAGRFLPDTVLASGDAAPQSAPILDSGYLYWLGSPRKASDPVLAGVNVVWRVDESGGSLPEPVHTGKPMIALAVNEDALYFGTSDGEVAKLAKPLARTKDPLP